MLIRVPGHQAWINPANVTHVKVNMPDQDSVTICFAAGGQSRVFYLKDMGQEEWTANRLITYFNNTERNNS